MDPTSRVSNYILYCFRCQNNLASLPGAIVTDTGSELRDFTLLTLCNHTAMSVGTFGYWAAILAGGEVVYFRNHVVKGSIAAGYFVDGHHFPESWLGL